MSDEVVGIDLGNYHETTGDKVNPGRYRLVVVDAHKEVSKQQNDMIVVEHRVEGGEFDGSTLIDRLVLTEKSLFRVVNFLQACGFPTPKRQLNFRMSQFKGKVVDADVEDGEPYKGRVKSEIRGYSRVRGPQRSAAAADLPTEEELAAGVAEHATADNPGVGGLAEFAKPTPQVANDPVPGDVSSLGHSNGASASPSEDDAPQEVDLDKLDI